MSHSWGGFSFSPMSPESRTGACAARAERKQEKRPCFSVDVFQAERRTCASNYTLVLNGFTRKVSACTSTCGDGIVTGNEVCDDGIDNGSYGGCQPDCVAWGPYCGDGTVNGPEQCDHGLSNGTNRDTCTGWCQSR